MSGGSRRRRAAVLLALALACGGLASSRIGGRAQEIESQVGAPVPVVVAARDLPPGADLRRRDLAVVEVPRRFVPSDAPSRPDQILGLSTAGPVAAGSPLTGGTLAGARPGGAGPGGLRRGERAIELPVAGAATLIDLAPGTARADVLVSTEASGGVGRTSVALEDVEVLALSPLGALDGGGQTDSGALQADAGAVGAPTATAAATLRVTLRQAVYLTAAQSFAREIRLLPRPPGDRRRIGRATVSADGL